MIDDHVHVSDLRWDRLLAGELAETAKADVLAAAAACPTCAARHAELTRDRDAFALRPPLARRPAVRRPWWLAAPVVLAAAAALALMVRARGPSDEPTERVKGTGPSLVVEAGPPGRLALVSSGDHVQPGDHVQAGYSATRAGFGAVLGRVGSAPATVYVPADGAAMTPLPAGGLRSFPASTVLDDVLGDEVLIVVWCERAWPLAPLVAELGARGDLAERAGCWHRRIVLTRQAVPE